MTGQWRLQPLPFGTLPEFLPHWSPEELVATYALVGGVPAYLAWLDPEQTLVENIKQVMLTRQACTRRGDVPVAGRGTRAAELPCDSAGDWRWRP